MHTFADTFTRYNIACANMYATPVAVASGVAARCQRGTTRGEVLPSNGGLCPDLSFFPSFVLQLEG